MEATIHGCRVFYRYQEADAGVQPPVLLLHGWGCDSSIFAALENGLKANASVLAVDFPGHGKSGEPPEPWGVPEYAEQLYTLLRQLNIEQVQLVAHSFGGRVALQLASKHPECVKRMVLTGGAGIRKPLSEAQRKRQARFKRLNGMLNAVKRVPFLRGLAGRLQDKLRKRFGSADYIKLNEVMRRTFVKVISEDLSPLLPTIAAPTLLVWGSEDTETPLWMGQQMEKQIPDAGLVVFEGRGHFAFVEEAQRFAVIVKEFFFGGQSA